MLVKQLIARLRRGLLLDPYWRRIMADVRRRGWGSASTSDDAGTKGWTYTVGFDETLNHPEIIVCGYSRAYVQRVLAAVYGAVKHGDLVIKDGLKWEIAGVGQFVWREVAPQYLGDDHILMARYRRWERTGSPAGVRAFQLVLPDYDGLYPWESGFDEVFGAAAPQLWDPALNTKVAANGGV
jgi:hypothetical protein